MEKKKLAMPEGELEKRIKSQKRQQRYLVASLGQVRPDNVDHAGHRLQEVFVASDDNDWRLTRYVCWAFRKCFS